MHFTLLLLFKAKKILKGDLSVSEETEESVKICWETVSIAKAAERYIGFYLYIHSTINDTQQIPVVYEAVNDPQCKVVGELKINEQYMFTVQSFRQTVKHVAGHGVVTEIVKNTEDTLTSKGFTITDIPGLYILCILVSCVNLIRNKLYL